MKKLSLKASLAESSNESVFQLIFVALISFWAKETTTTGLMSMTSSIVMIGITAAESHLTFGLKNELEGVSVFKHVKLLATFLPVFILTAMFRIGSLTLIMAQNWQMGLLWVLPCAALIFLGVLLALKLCCRKLAGLEKLSIGDIFVTYSRELSTISNWGRLGREESRKLQLVAAAHHLLVYSIFLLVIINDPSYTWFTPDQVYYPDPATLSAWSIAALCFGAIAIILQLFLPKILQCCS